MRQSTAIAGLVMGPLEWILLIVLSILWGGSFFFAAVALEDVGPFTVVLTRVLLAAILLYGFIRLTGRHMPSDRRTWAGFFGMGLLNNVIPFSLIFWGQTHIASGLASILNATTPLFTVLVAHILTHNERLTVSRLLGVVIGFAGVVIMIGADLLTGLGDNLLAQLAILGAALTYAFASIFGRRFRDLPPISTAAGQVTASTVMMLPVWLIVDRPWELPMPSAQTIAALVALGALSTALAYSLYFRVLRSAGATNISLVTFLVPVSALLLGMMILGERLEPKHFIGMALIGVGLAALDGRPWRLLMNSLVQSRS
ncbi:MAG TPA: DMT family transporter [Dongiaceae bacterium]